MCVFSPRQSLRGLLEMLLMIESVSPGCDEYKQTYETNKLMEQKTIKQTNQIDLLNNQIQITWSQMPNTTNFQYTRPNTEYTIPNITHLPKYHTRSWSHYTKYHVGSQILNTQILGLLVMVELIFSSGNRMPSLQTCKNKWYSQALLLVKKEIKFA